MSTPFSDKRRRTRSGELAPLGELRREMERLFDNFRSDPLSWLPEPFAGGGEWSPPIDLVERDNEIAVRIEIPGVDPKELEVSVMGNTLSVSGEKKETIEKNEGGRHHVETYYGSFSRSVTLPEEVDSENVDANYEQGVLTVRLNKTKKAQGRRIEVRTSSDE